MFAKSNITGIEISSADLRLVELSGSQKKQIKTIGALKLPQGLFEQGVLKDEAGLVVQLKSLFKSLKLSLRGRKVALALEGSAVVIRLVKIPTAAGVDLAELVEIEAEQQFQHDLQDLYFTWKTLTNTANANETAVLLVGAKKTVVDQYISVLKKIGCRVRIIDCDIFAQLNILEYSYGPLNELSSLISISTNTTQVVFVGEGQYLYSREIAFGFNTYINTIADSLAIPADQASTLLLAGCDDPSTVSGSLETAIKLGNGQLCAEIELIMDFFFQTTSLAPPMLRVKRIFLAGLASYVYNLVGTLSEKIGATITIVDPFAKIPVVKEASSALLNKYPAQYTTVMGLALREEEAVGQGV